MSNFLRAFCVFIGTVIGVGVFALPYISMQTGFSLLVFYLFALGYIVFVIHKTFGEVALGTEGFLRLPGYVKLYLGGKISKLYSATVPFNFAGVLVLYIIIGGNFLYGFLSPYFGGSAFLYSIIFFVMGSVFVFFGIKSISLADLLFIVFLIVVTTLLLLKGLPYFDISNLAYLNPEKFIFPYGAVLFSLWGLSIVPELEDILGRDSKKITKVIKYGLLFSIFYYIFFTAVVFGISGEKTTQDAFSGLFAVMGDGFLRISLLLGFFNCFTSFLAIGLTFKKVFWYDFKLNKHVSFLISMGLPLVIFLLGIREFVNTLSIIGALFLGIDSIFVIWIYKRFCQKEGKKFPVYFYPLPSLFILGVALTLIYIH